MKWGAGLTRLLPSDERPQRHREMVKVTKKQSFNVKPYGFLLVFSLRLTELVSKKVHGAFSKPPSDLWIGISYWTGTRAPRLSAFIKIFLLLPSEPLRYFLLVSLITLDGALALSQGSRSRQEYRVETWLQGMDLWISPDEMTHALWSWAVAIKILTFAMYVLPKKAFPPFLWDFQTCGGWFV